MVCYTEKGHIIVPDNEIKEKKPGHKYAPLRGYGYLMAVFQEENCIGFIRVTHLGYRTVSKYMER